MKFRAKLYLEGRVYFWQLLHNFWQTLLVDSTRELLLMFERNRSTSMPFWLNIIITNNSGIKNDSLYKNVQKIPIDVLNVLVDFDKKCYFFKGHETKWFQTRDFFHFHNKGLYLMENEWILKWNLTIEFLYLNFQAAVFDFLKPTVNNFT